jgi:hypothetical protein
MARMLPRTLHVLLSAGFLGGVLMVAGPAFAAEPAAASGKCTIATKGTSKVAKACAEGGIKAAKAAMKSMVKEAKANGVKFTCDDCHSDDTEYKLADDASEKFKKLLAAIEGGGKGAPTAGGDPAQAAPPAGAAPAKAPKK